MESTFELISRIYDAASDPSRWPEFLGAVIRATHCSKGSLALVGHSTKECSIVCWHGWTDEDIRLYGERYAEIEPCRKGIAQLAEGEVITTHSLLEGGEREFEEHIVYREFYGPTGAHHGLGGCILRTEIGASGITMMREKKDGPCGEREMSILRPLMPHLRRAALLHGELTSLRTQLAAFTDHLDRYPQAFLLTGADRRILYLNAAARDITGRRDGLALESGRLLILSPARDTELRTAVRETASNRESPLRRIVVERLDGKALYRLLLMPLAGSGMMPLDASRPTVAILIIDAGSPPQPDPTILRELFSLTAAEARFAGKLALGWSVEEIAAENRVSIETARTHLKRVLSKTSTNRQGELISLILRSAPFRSH